jgi:hypothetical protein
LVWKVMIFEDDDEDDVDDFEYADLPERETGPL